MKNENKFKVVLTGGHMSPLLAVLPELEKSAECVVIGRKHSFEQDKEESLEYRTLHAMHVKFYNLKAARLQRKFTRYTASSLFKLPTSLYSARKILRFERPDVILTFGGYVALPVCAAGKALGIPIVLHEQTQKAGLTNKLIGKIAQKICVSYPSSLEYFPKHKTVVTGNPLRFEVLKATDKVNIPLTKPLLTIMGGSSGSHRINMYMKEILSELLLKFSVIHQTGNSEEFRDFDTLSDFRESLSSDLKDRYVVKKFILPEEIGWVYKHTGIFVCRAGANTVSELIALKKKALLIPLPFSQLNEQLENAKLYKQSELGDYILEKDIDPEKLYTVIQSIFEKKEVKSDVPDGTPDSVSKIVDVVKEVIRYETKTDSIKLPQEG